MPAQIKFCTIVLQIFPLPPKHLLRQLLILRSKPQEISVFDSVAAETAQYSIDP